MSRHSTIACWLLAVFGALCGCSDDADQAGGSGPVDWEGASAGCKKWCEAFVPCSGGEPWFHECANDCRENYYAAGCETEKSAMMSCQADYWAHSCVRTGGGCTPEENAYFQCRYANPECESDASTCNCRVTPFDVELEVDCRIVGTSEGAGGAAEGGAGEGGSPSNLVVECHCIADGDLEYVCQRDTLDCDVYASCCPSF